MVREGRGPANGNRSGLSAGEVVVDAPLQAPVAQPSDWKREQASASSLWSLSEFYNLTREQVICKSSHQVSVGKDRSCTWILPVDLLNEAELTKYNISCVTRSIVNLSKL